MLSEISQPPKSCVLRHSTYKCFHFENECQLSGYQWLRTKGREVLQGLGGGTIKGQHRDRCGIGAVGILMAMCYLNLHR